MGYISSIRQRYIGTGFPQLAFVDFVTLEKILRF
jgi:hypothetical protein